MTRSYGNRPRTNMAASGHREQDRTRERERGALYRVLLLVRWRRRERQVVSGLRRKNTGHAHTRTHTGACPCPAGHREGPPQAVAPDGVHPSIWKTSVPTPALGRLPALPNSTEEAKFSSRRTARKLSTTEGKFASKGRPSNPWEYYSVRHSVQEHLNEKHPDYFISKIEYYSYRPGYVFQLSNDYDSFIIDHFLTTLYCHHDMCAP